MTTFAIRPAKTLRNNYLAILVGTVAAIVWWNPVVMGIALGINALCWALAVAVLSAEIRFSETAERDHLEQSRRPHMK